MLAGDFGGWITCITAEEPPRRLEATDHLLGRLEERRPHELVAAEARREDESLAHPVAVPVGDESEPAEVHLQLGSRRRVVDAHGHGPAPRTAPLDREARQGAMRDDDALALEEDPDLDDGEPVGHPRLDLFLLGEERPPRAAVAVGAVRPDRLDQPAHQLVGELPLTAGAVDAEPDRGGDVAPRRLAVDADRPGDGALALPAQPPSERLSNLDHRDLPERHGASSASGFGDPAESLFGRRRWMVRVVP